MHVTICYIKHLKYFLCKLIIYLTLERFSSRVSESLRSVGPLDQQVFAYSMGLSEMAGPISLKQKKGLKTFLLASLVLQKHHLFSSF